jgi:MYXO-CTERM domain-containing protein
MNRNASAVMIVMVVASFSGTAHATEHMMVVNEILISTGGDPSAQLIELWDIGDEPFPNATYAVDVFDAEGASLARVPAPGISGGGGSRYYLLSTPGADSALGITADAPLTTALPEDGQACFIGTNDRRVHCVAWGCVNMKVTPATPLGASPADGMSLQRTPTGADLTVAAPTPGAANATGTMDDPCPVTPTPDAGGDDMPDDGGGCGCRGTSDATTPTLMLALLALAGAWRRRRV